MLRSARALRALVSTLALCTLAAGCAEQASSPPPQAAAAEVPKQSRIGRRLVPSLLRHKQFRAQRTGTDDRQTGRICRREHRLHARNGHREDRSHRRPDRPTQPCPNNVPKPSATPSLAPGCRLPASIRAGPEKPRKMSPRPTMSPNRAIGWSISPSSSNRRDVRSAVAAKRSRESLGMGPHRIRRAIWQCSRSGWTVGLRPTGPTSTAPREQHSEHFTGRYRSELCGTSPFGLSRRQSAAACSGVRQTKLVTRDSPNRLGGQYERRARS